MRTLTVGLMALSLYSVALTTSAHAQGSGVAATPAQAQGSGVAATPAQAHGSGVAATPAWVAPTPPSPSGGASPSIQLSSTIQMSIDTPSEGTSVTNGVRLVLAGWAADTAADGTTGDAGIDVIKVYLDGPMDAGIPLGVARSGVTRTDVASALGNAQFAGAGFDYAWTPAQIGPGPHVLFVYAHSSVSNSWAYRSVAINGPAGSVAGVSPNTAAMSQTGGAYSPGMRSNPWQGPPTPYGGSYLNNSVNNAANYLGGQSRYGAGYGGYYLPPQPCIPAYTGAYPITGGSGAASTSQGACGAQAGPPAYYPSNPTGN